MSSRSRLVLLVGVIALGAAVFAIFTLLRPDRSDPAPDARAYLAGWGQRDWAGMARDVADPPSDFADAHQAVVDDLHVIGAKYTLGAVDKAKSGKTAVARFTAKLQLDGLGEWSYGGALSMRHAGGNRWQVDWSPATIHPDLKAGQHLARTRDVPARAPILDDHGKPLASGRPGRVIGLEPDAIKDLNQIKAAFKAELGIDPAAIDAALHAPGVKPNHFVTITTVDDARYEQVQAVIYPLPGTRFRNTFIRGGPTPNFAVHVLGRVGDATAEKLEQLGQPYQAGDQVGLTGIEARFERQLAGTPSGQIRTVDAKDHEVKVVGRITGKKPEPVKTTLDATDQAAVEAALGATTQRIAVVVVDKDSNVRAVASRPLDEYNRAFGGSYPPGSTFKVVTTTALLGSGVTPTTPVQCAPTINEGGRSFKNFESSSLGTVPFGLAFAQSCNTAFISAAADVPDDKLQAAAETFGFNADYTVGLDTKGGSFPTPQDATEHAAASIGQGRITASPLHMATVAAATLSGSWHPPLLLPDLPAGDRPAGRPLPPGTAATLHSLMRRVVTEGSGTAANVAPDVTGKTGTAEFGNANPPQTHAWFIGTRGDLAVAVLVEGGGVGGRVAAPLAGRILAGLPG